MKTMKNIYFILAAAASLAFASCTSDELVGGENQGTEQSLTGDAIVFGSLAPALTRADLYGAGAASKLSEKFVVYGTKHMTDNEDKTAANDAVQFNNFQVQWTASTAGTSESNSSDWDYVGLQAYDATPTSQGIKYWDYAAKKGYTFYAFSSTDISYPKAETDKVQVTKVTADETSLYNKGYAATVKDGANLSNLYFSDRVEVPRAQYGKTVSLTFRNIGTMVRFAFYETIPGYTVQIDKFYIDADAAAAVTDFKEMKDAKADGFYASLQNVKSDVSQTMNVTYYSDGADINRPKLSNPTGGYNYTMKLGSAASIIGKTLGTTASNPTWVDGTAGTYTPVYPFVGNNNPMLVKLDFTMTADDGSADVIHVKGARAIVPAQAVQWKSNFAYTYIFKISDRTNGTTGETDENDEPVDPEGLKPITFDAIVVDVTEERQQTISSVSTNSITTYAEGAITDEYKVGQSIYVALSNTLTGNIITPAATGDAATQAQIYKLDKATTEATVLAKLTGSPVDITLTAVADATVESTVPLADGTTPEINNVKFTPSTAGYYAYVYTAEAYVAPNYTVQTDKTYDSGKTYYMKSGNGVFYAVSVPTEAAFNAYKESLWLKTDNGTPGEFEIKVIKVQ